MVPLFSKEEIEATCNSIVLSSDILSLYENNKRKLLYFVVGSDVFLTGYGKSLCLCLSTGVFV